MFIQTETTPNPDTMKFLPGRAVLSDRTAQFNDPSQADKSPLALALFDLADVKSVFLGMDFISVTKASAASWDTLKTEVLTTIMDHFTSGAPVMHEDGDTATKPEMEDDEISGQIRELIDTRVRPAVAQDGGDIIFHRFEDDVVFLEMHGACSGCPSSTITLKSGIENMLKHYIPEVESVEAVGMDMADY